MSYFNEMTDEQYAEWLRRQSTLKLSALKEEIQEYTKLYSDTSREFETDQDDLRLINAELKTRKIEAAEWKCP